jgi:hypothetical protein
LIADAIHQLNCDYITHILILGDYNHQKEYYEKDLKNTGYSLIMPASGTMAGFEHGNNNKPIDGALVNCPDEVNVNVLQQSYFAEQVTLPLKININVYSSSKIFFNK